MNHNFPNKNRTVPGYGYFALLFLLLVVSVSFSGSLFAQTQGPKYPTINSTTATFRPCANHQLQNELFTEFANGFNPVVSGTRIEIALPQGLEFDAGQTQYLFGTTNNANVFKVLLTIVNPRLGVVTDLATAPGVPPPATDTLENFDYYGYIKVSCEAKDFYFNGGNMAIKVRTKSTNPPVYDITRDSRSIGVTWPAPTITGYTPSNINNAVTNSNYQVVMNVENGGLDGYVEKGNGGFPDFNIPTNFGTDPINIHAWFNLPMGIFSIGTVEIGDGTTWVNVTSDYNSATQTLAVSDANMVTLYNTTSAVHNTGGANSGYKIRFQLNTLAICNPPSHSWNIYTGWQCTADNTSLLTEDKITNGDNWCDYARRPYSVSFPQETPLIGSTPVAKNIKCLDGSGEFQILKLYNTSPTDTAFNMFTNISVGGWGVGPDGIKTPIDFAQISYEIHKDAGGGITMGGGNTSNRVNYSSSAEITNYGCTNDPNACRGFTANCPALGPGDTLYVKFYYYNCPFLDACIKPTGYDRYIEEWTYSGGWENRCGIDFPMVGALGKGYEFMMPSGTPTTFPVQQATNIRDNESLFFGLGYSNWYPDEMEVTLPVGFVFDGNLADVYVANDIRSCFWNPASFTQVGNVLKFFFPPSSQPGCWTSGMFRNAEFQVKLRYDCSLPGAGNASNTIQFAGYYSYDPTCPKIKYGCDDNRVVSICVIPPCTGGGMVPDYQDMVRVNYGLPDADNNYLPDGAGSVDPTQIRRFGFANADSFKHVYQGHIVGGTLTMTNAYVENDIPWTDLTIYQVVAKVVDASTGTVYTQTLPASSPCLTITQSGGHTYIKTDANCAGVPSGFIYENDDTVRVEVYARFNTVPAGGNILYNETNNLIYASTYPNPPVGPDRLVCGPDIFGQYLTIGSYYTTYSYYSGNYASCGDIPVSSNFYFSMGPCCTYYQQGNWFRKEYRDFSYLDTVTFTIPTPDFYFNTAMKVDLTFYHSAGTTTFTNITPDVISGNVIKVRASQFYNPPYGTGSLLLSDEGYSGTATVHLLPTCKANGGYNFPIDYNFNGIHGQPGANVGSTGSFTYYKPNMDLLPDEQLVYVDPTTAEWEVTLKNISPIATGDNVFMGFPSISGNYDVTDVIEIWNNIQGTINSPRSESAPGSDVYGLGNFNVLLGGAPTPYIRKYRIKANTEYCTQDTMRVVTGSDCAGYPTNLAEFTCQTQFFPLFVTYPDAALQAITTNEPPLDGMQMCGTDTVAYKIRCTKLSELYNIISTIQFPAHLKYVNGTTEFKWPTTAAWTSTTDPTTISSSTKRFNISAYDSDLQTDGLLGVLHPDSSIVEVRFQIMSECGYTNGQRLRNTITATRTCEGPLDPPFLNYTSPINIYGLPDGDYTTTNSISLTGSNCQKTQVLEVKLINNGPGLTGTADSIKVTLPSGFAFTSYNSATSGSHNAPTVQPTLGGGSPETLVWDFPNAIAVGDSVVFYVTADLASGTCSVSSSAEVLSYVGATAYCITTMMNCSAGYQTGIATSSTLNVALPEFVLTQNTATNVFDGDNTNYFTYNVDIQNTGANAVAGYKLEFYGDANSNGMFDSGEPILGENLLPAIPAGVTITGYSNTITYLNSTFNPGPFPGSASTIGAIVRPSPASGGSQCVCANTDFTFNSTLLPVKLVSFEVKGAKNCSNSLKWVTAEERNADRFEILHSKDGIHFVKVGEVKALGNSNSEKVYTFSHDVESNINYYRLRVVDNDGKSSLSSTRYTVNSCVSSNAENGIVRFYPNPTNGTLTLEVLWLNETSKNTRAFVMDLTGRIVQEYNVNVSNDMNFVTLDVSGLSSGTYMIHLLTGNNKNNVKKFVKID